MFVFFLRINQEKNVRPTKEKKQKKLLHYIFSLIFVASNIMSN